MSKTSSVWLACLVVTMGTGCVAGTSAAAVAWLDDHTKLASTVKLKPSVGALLLQDASIELSMYLGGIFGATVGPGPAGEITNIDMKLVRWEINGPCATIDEPVARILHLPWLTELEWRSGRYWVKILDNGKMRPGYAIECETVIGKVVDTCFVNNARMFMETTGDRPVGVGFDVSESGEEQCAGTPFSGKGFITTERRPLSIAAEDGVPLSVGDE